MHEVAPIAVDPDTRRVIDSVDLDRRMSSHPVLYLLQRSHRDKVRVAERHEGSRTGWRVVRFVLAPRLSRASRPSAPREQVAGPAAVIVSVLPPTPEQ
jgi:hypothetical protein